MKTELAPTTLSSHENRLSFQERLSSLEPSEREGIMQGYDFGKLSHRDQVRTSGERFFEHPRRTAIILMDECHLYDPAIIISALLHDTLEDTFIFGHLDNVSNINAVVIARQSISERFPPQIAENIIYLTKPPINGIDVLDENQALQLYYEKLTSAPEQAILIKMADRLDNLRTMGSINDTKKERKYLETQNIYLPLFEHAIVNFTENSYKKAGMYLLEKIKELTPTNTHT